MRGVTSGWPQTNTKADSFQWLVDAGVYVEGELEATRPTPVKVQEVRPESEWVREQEEELKAFGLDLKERLAVAENNDAQDAVSDEYDVSFRNVVEAQMAKWGERDDSERRRVWRLWARIAELLGWPETQLGELVEAYVAQEAA